jgi:hypothetical protein
MSGRRAVVSAVRAVQNMLCYVMLCYGRRPNRWGFCYALTSLTTPAPLRILTRASACLAAGLVALFALDHCQGTALLTLTPGLLLRFVLPALPSPPCPPPLLRVRTRSPGPPAPHPSTGWRSLAVTGGAPEYLMIIAASSDRVRNDQAHNLLVAILPFPTWSSLRPCTEMMGFDPFEERHIL